MTELRDVDRMFRLDGKVALITGGERAPTKCSLEGKHAEKSGSRGLGLHTATAFLHAGAERVIITARKAEGAGGINQAVKKLNKLAGVKGTAVGIPANVSNEAEIIRLVEYVKKTEGKLDILVANAGATWGSKFEDAPDHSSAKILDLNVRGVFLLAQK
jgi:NAD(P)-dependent dehydrogenase (short-subunit alcohol dehydrogenase family)